MKRKNMTEREFKLIRQLLANNFSVKDTADMCKRSDGLVYRVRQNDTFEKYLEAGRVTAFADREAALTEQEHEVVCKDDSGAVTVEIEPVNDTAEEQLDPVLRALTGIENGINSILELQRQDYTEKKEWLSRKRRFF